ncbi:unnamed protein product, partial [Meganyctiphanes norvegica]
MNDYYMKGYSIFNPAGARHSVLLMNDYYMKGYSIFNPQHEAYVMLTNISTHPSVTAPLIEEYLYISKCHSPVHFVILVWKRSRVNNIQRAYECHVTLAVGRIHVMKQATSKQYTEDIRVPCNNSCWQNTSVGRIHVMKQATTKQFTEGHKSVMLFAEDIIHLMKQATKQYNEDIRVPCNTGYYQKTCVETSKIHLMKQNTCDKTTMLIIHRETYESHTVSRLHVIEHAMYRVDQTKKISYMRTKGTLYFDQPCASIISQQRSSPCERPPPDFIRVWLLATTKYGRSMAINDLLAGHKGQPVYNGQPLKLGWPFGTANIQFLYLRFEKPYMTAAQVKRLKPKINKKKTYWSVCWPKGPAKDLWAAGGRRRINYINAANPIQCHKAFSHTNNLVCHLRIHTDPINATNVTKHLRKKSYYTSEDMCWGETSSMQPVQCDMKHGIFTASILSEVITCACERIQNTHGLLQVICQGISQQEHMLNPLNGLRARLSLCMCVYVSVHVCKHACMFMRATSITSKLPLGRQNLITQHEHAAPGGNQTWRFNYKQLVSVNIIYKRLRNTTAPALVDTTPDEEERETGAPDVFAIGFEEIVDLNAQNIVASASTSDNAVSWGKEMEKVLSRDEEFVMVTWGQLVGVALFVYVNAKHANHVRSVSVESVKTGMQGTTGNKGAVGIRLVVRNTSLAFVCSHFAAGQKEINERNNDYETTARKMIFPLGIPLWAHDYVFWCGDFNYRINLGRDEVMDLVQRREWEQLLEGDQLMISKNEGKCFKGFIEGEICFAPTYKYDLFSDDYDTSEKCRVPAWTDRVLFWRRQYQKDQNNPNWKPGKIVHYGRAELKQSDHRPVLSVIDIEGRTVDNDKLQKVYESVVEELGPSDCTIVVQILNANPHNAITSALRGGLYGNVRVKMNFSLSVGEISFSGSLFFFYRDPITLKKSIALLQTNMRVKLYCDLKFLLWFNCLQLSIITCAGSVTSLAEEEPGSIQAQTQSDRIWIIEIDLESLNSGKVKE